LRRAVVILGLAVWLGGIGPSPASAKVAIELRKGDNGKQEFHVTGLSQEALVRFESLKPGDDSWHAHLAVYVGALVQEDQLPILGDYALEKGDILFRPNYPLTPGAAYTAVWHEEGKPDAGSLKTKFVLPADKPTPPATVTAVYPTRSVLPENQLKFYLHFSAPMSRGEAYRRIHLVKASGEEVEAPFLELGEELWDESGTRFTLFFDPGRIKRGLKPREEVGPSLVEGESYTLVIDRDWLDAKGQPLKQSFRKPFRAVSPDDKQPDMRQWKLTPPQSGAKDALVVTFPEPLDEAMLQRTLWIEDGFGKAVAGKVQVAREETRWEFQPERPWKAGKYLLVADVALEDLAGNSLARPFEVDELRPVERESKTQTVRLEFTVGGK
jgi:hypothetical protein